MLVRSLSNTSEEAQRVRSRSQQNSPGPPHLRHHQGEHEAVGLDIRLPLPQDIERLTDFGFESLERWQLPLCQLWEG